MSPDNHSPKTAQFRTDLSCTHLPSTVGMKTIRQALDEHIHLCTFCAWYVCKLVIRVQCTDVYDKTLIVFEFNCIRPCVCVWEHVSMWQLFVRCCFAVGAVALNHVTILKSAKGAHGHQSSSRVECVESFNPRPQTPAKVYRTSFGDVTECRYMYVRVCTLFMRIVLIVCYLRCWCARIARNTCIVYYVSYVLLGACPVTNARTLHDTCRRVYIFRSMPSRAFRRCVTLSQRGGMHNER